VENNPIQTLGIRIWNYTTKDMTVLELARKDDFSPQNPVCLPVLYNMLVFLKMLILLIYQLQNNIKESKRLPRRLA
jgi:hypothetical protein